MSFAAPLRRSVFAVITAGAVLAAGIATAAETPAPVAPPAKASRELVRRVLLDSCVYAESAKDDVKKEKIVDACQCASTRALKDVKDEEIVKVDQTRQIPDSWYSVTTDAYAGCRR